MSFSWLLFSFYPLSLLPISSQKTERWGRNMDIRGVRRLGYRIRKERLEAGVEGWGDKGHSKPLPGHGTH